MREALSAKLINIIYIYIYRVGKSSISEFLPEVFNSIFEELKEYIEVKTGQELKKNFCNLIRYFK